MKTELKTTDVLNKLVALHQHYIKVANDAGERGNETLRLIRLTKAEGVANAIHEIELMAALKADVTKKDLR